MDILFVIPSNDRVYQELKTTYSSIEPPTWGLLLAESCRSVGHEVGILDMNAENQSHEQGLQRIKELNPKWLCFVVYGQNVNAGTVSMYGATQLSKYLKSSDCKIPNIFVGSYMQALPIKALQDEPSIDIVLTNEGVYALWALAGIQATTDPSTLGQINGIGFRKDGKPFLTAPGKIVPQERMDIDLPGYAWDLLPKKEKPFDLYRAPMWHANYDANLRTPYATLFSSFGCKFGCNFCLSAGTKITLSHDKNKKIEDVKIGDKLLAWDENKLEISETVVIVSNNLRSEKIYHIKLTDNKIVKCTGEHPFYNDGTWVNAENLKIGDKILVVDANDKNIFRMKHYNPMFVNETRSKTSKTSKERFITGKTIPHLCTEKGREMASKMAREKMLSDANPMYSRKNQDKASERFLKEKNPKWDGGKCVKFKPYYLSKNRRVRKSVKIRDNNTCQECKKTTGKLDVHHIDYNKYNNQTSNLITLCASCHSKTNFDRGFGGKRYTKIMLEKAINCPHYVRIEDIKVIDENTETFNLQCEPHNNFYANNVLTHNCMINIINRNDNDPIGVASNYKGMRYWSPEFILKQFDKLHEMGVSTIRLCDEMFLLNSKYYVPICEGLAKKEYSKDLLLWAYSRIDTVSKDPGVLKLLRKAGFRWLCLGIESGRQKIRLEISKGKFLDVDIRDVVKKIEEADIEVLGNYLFGHIGDDYESMKATLDLSLELATRGWNAYAVMPLPGSQIYKEALDKGDAMPTDYLGFSFHAYETFPMHTNHLSNKEVLKFRDDAFLTYHTNPKFLIRIKEKFGQAAVDNILQMTKIKLQRQLHDK